MGRSSNRAKQRWDAAHYVQIKIRVHPETASAFKTACAANEVSMASTLAAFMTDFAGLPAKYVCNSIQHSPLPTVTFRTDSLKERRKTMSSVCCRIAELINGENNYIRNTPENLHSSAYYELAEERLSRLVDVLDDIKDIYI